jgi:transketolase
LRREFIDQLTELALADQSIMLLTGDLGYGVLERFRDLVPQQFLNLGIAEQSMMGIAAGLAKCGYRPFVYSIGNFPSMRCMEQIRNDVVYMDLPVTIVALGAGFSYGSAGYSHHLVDDIGAMRAFDLEVYVPDGPSCSKKVINRIIERRRPAYVRLGRGGECDSKTAIHLIDSSEVRIADKSQVIILSVGSISTEIDEVLDLLKTSSINSVHLSVECFSDISKIRNILEKWSGPIVTVEEHVLRGGFGSFILEELSMLNKKILRIGIRELNRKLVGSQEFLRSSYGLNSSAIYDQIYSFVEEVGV